MGKRLQLKQVTKQKMRMSRRQIVIAGMVSMLALAVGLTFLFNLSGIHSTLASVAGGATSSANSYTDGMESGIAKWTSDGNATWSSSTKYRSGAKSASVQVPYAKGDCQVSNTNLAIAVPATGKYYITVIAYAMADVTGGVAYLGLRDKNNSANNLSSPSVAPVSGSWTKISSTFAVKNGTTYFPYLVGNRTAKGSTYINIYYDDVVMYLSTYSGNDEKAPTSAVSLKASYSNGDIDLGWASGTDTMSGIDGSLVLRTKGFVTTSPSISSQVPYAPLSANGPASIVVTSPYTSATTWSVVYNGSSMVADTDTCSSLAGSYTYLIYMRDKAYNYSATPLRAYVVAGTNQVAVLPSSSQVISAFYIAKGDSMTVPAGYSLTFLNGVVDGVLVNQESLSMSAGGSLIFNPNAAYVHKAGKTTACSVPTATWQTGSSCIINGYPKGKLATAVGGLSQTFYNLTWKCDSQTVASSLAGATVQGALTVSGTGSSYLTVADSLHIGKDFKQTAGSLFFNAKASCLYFNGTSAQNYTQSGGVLLGTISLVLNNSGNSLLLNNALTISGFLNLRAGKLDNSVQKLTLGNGAIITRAIGTVAALPTLSGMVDVTYNNPCTTGYELPAGTSALHKLYIRTSGNVMLNKAITINDSFILKNGTFTIGNYNLVLITAAKLSGYSSKSYVVTNGSGFFKINGLGRAVNTNKVWFPVGTSTASYTPAAVQNQGTSDTFRVRVYDKVYNAYTSAGVPASKAVEQVAGAVKKTWLIEEGTVGGSAAVVTLQWNSSDEGSSFNLASCSVDHYTGGVWKLGANAMASGNDPYSQSITDLSSFSPFSVSGSNHALPVELTSFDVTKEQSIARLEWVTASELNNDHFEIERSLDAQEWDPIASIQGHGTTNISQEYTYIDHDVAVIDGTSAYYRLKQVDFNGKFEYSPIKKLELTAKKGSNAGTGLKAWYNSTDFKLYASLEQEESHNMQAMLINISGQLVSKLMVIPDKGAPTQIGFDMSKLANGVYTLIVQANDTVKTTKIIKN